MDSSKGFHNPNPQQGLNVFDLVSYDTKSCLRIHCEVKASRLYAELFLESDFCLELPKFISILFHKSVDLYFI
jgi:hypothetical protein